MGDLVGKELAVDEEDSPSDHRKITFCINEGGMDSTGEFYWNSSTANWCMFREELEEELGELNRPKSVEQVEAESRRRRKR